MSIYIWLRPDAVEKLEDLKKQGILRVGVELDNRTGKPYVSLYWDIIDPAAPDLSVPQEIVERVTIRETIYRGFRTEGLYRHCEVELMVKTGVKSKGPGDCVECQEVSASAPDVDQLRGAYSLLRQGKLQPCERWEDEDPPTPPAKTQKNRGEKDASSGDSPIFGKGIEF
ncbi:MAG: hypothetical protein A2469_01220 [Candidatus Magasanikbacteria bacterium RIFOXYC2_FULL_40_16]|uniref:Uncharacterized protein n=1 Tax=Candidatus Magasanikbacteria bacterium RIFOXYC2_FULL_40_16 TaxID=1798703 RepID=A0A1F6P2L2_9BACT|nr:MAG: hypothetical protein A2469_01220 [Candidatus Magasanikbacteria bacterium RIFOXYC2_FULL_40_16]